MADTHGSARFGRPVGRYGWIDRIRRCFRNMPVALRSGCHPGNRLHDGLRITTIAHVGADGGAGVRPMPGCGVRGQVNLALYNGGAGGGVERTLHPHA